MIKVFEFKNYYSYKANSYILYNNHFCLLIDPRVDDDCIFNFVSNNNLIVKGIILTHAHFDHIEDLKYFINKYNCPLFMHKSDYELLSNPSLNCSFLIDKEIMVDDVEASFIDNHEILNILGDDIEIIHTPFHTQGSICLYISSIGVLISGDTLFYNSIGRYDLPTSNVHQIIPSINLLKQLPKETKVLPGHGQNTTLTREFNK